MIGGAQSTTNNKKGVLNFSDDSIYEGDLIDGIMYGEGIIKYNNGDIYTGNFVNGKMDVGTFEYKNGDIYTGNFVDSKKDGVGLYISKDKIKYNCTYVAGILHGTCKIIFPDGVIYDSEYTNNNINIIPKPTSLKNPEEYNIVLYICAHRCTVKDKPINIQYKQFFNPKYVTSTDLNCTYIFKPDQDIAYIAGLFNDTEDIMNLQ